LQFAHDLTATSLDLAADDGGETGHAAVDSWMPQVRNWMSSMGPLSVIAVSVIRRLHPDEHLLRRDS
jgi:hypothetical protein